MAEVFRLEAIFTGDDRGLLSAAGRSESALKTLRTTTNAVVRDITSGFPGISPVLNGVARDLIRLSTGSQKASEDVRALSGAYGQFQRVLAQVSAGKNVLAGDVFKDFSINAERGLRAPKQAFSQFISEFQRFPDAEGRARIAVDVFGTSAAKVIPILEGTTVAMGAEAAAATTAAEATTLFESALVPLVAIGAVVAGIFLLAKGAADAGSEIYDLSQKTGFAAETLSGLKNAAETSGGSLESITSGLTMFNSKASEATEKGSHLSKVFKSLGIDAKDNETQLRQAFKVLNDITNAETRARAAKELFGRSYKDILGVIKETNGNLDEAISKYRQMGTIISTEDAKAADQFGDQMTELWQSIKGLGRELGNAFIPVVSALASAVNVLVIALKGWALVLEKIRLGSSLVEDAVGSIRASNPVLDALATMGGALGRFKKPEAEKDVDLPGGGKGSGESKAQRAARQALEALQLGAQRAERIATDELATENSLYENSLQSLERFVTRKREIEEKRYAEDVKTFAAERALVDASVLDRGEKALKLAQINEKEAASLSKHNQTLRQIEDDRRAKEKSARDKHFEVLSQIEDIFDERELNDRRAMMEQGLTTREEYETRANAVLYDSHQRRMHLIAIEIQEAGNDQEKMQAVLDEKLRAEEQFINAYEEGLRRIAKAREEDLEDARRYSETLRNLNIDSMLLAVSIGRGRLGRDESLGVRNSRSTRREQDKLDIEEENQFHRQRVIEAIEAEGRRLLAINTLDRNATEQRKKIEEEFYEYSILLGVQHEDRLREIQERPLIELRERLKVVAGDIGDIFGNAIREWDGTFKGFFRSVLQGFADMLRDMAAQLMQSVVTKALTSILARVAGSLLGGVFGGGGSSTGFLSTSNTMNPGGLIPRAAGGPVWAGQNFLVGEHGPEILKMGFGGGMVTPTGRGRSGDTHIYNINVPVAASSGYSAPQSRRQLAEAIFRKLR